MEFHVIKSTTTFYSMQGKGNFFSDDDDDDGDGLTVFPSHFLFISVLYFFDLAGDYPFYFILPSFCAKCSDFHPFD